MSKAWLKIGVQLKTGKIDLSIAVKKSDRPRILGTSDRV